MPAAETERLKAMDITALALLLLPCFVWLSFHFLILGSTHRKSFQARLPPGPRHLPIIGNILEFGDKPHQSLTTLSKTYGPLMSLKLGRLSRNSPTSANLKRPSLFWQDSPQCLPSSQPSPFFNGIFTSIGSLGQPQDDMQNAGIFPATC